MNSVICNSYTLPLNFNNYPLLVAIVLSIYSLLNLDYFFLIYYLVVVQLLSCVRLFVTTWTGTLQAFLSFTISWSLLRLMSSELMIPSNNLILCFPLLLNLSQHQGLFQWVSFLTSGGQSIGASASASVLPMNIQGWFPFRWTGWISLLSKGLSRVLSSTTVQKHQFFSAQPSLWSNSHIHIWLLEKPYLWLNGPLLAKWCLCFFIHLVLSQLFFQGASIF